MQKRIDAAPIFRTLLIAAALGALHAPPAAQAAGTIVTLPITAEGKPTVQTKYLCRNGSASLGEIQNPSTDGDVARAQIKGSPGACKSLPAPEGTASDAAPVGKPAGKKDAPPAPGKVVSIGTKVTGPTSVQVTMRRRDYDPETDDTPDTKTNYLCRNGGGTLRAEIQNPSPDPDTAQEQIRRADNVCQAIFGQCRERGRIQGRYQAAKFIVENRAKIDCGFSVTASPDAAITASFQAQNKACTQGGPEDYRTGYLEGETAAYREHLRSMKCQAVPPNPVISGYGQKDGGLDAQGQPKPGAPVKKKAGGAGGDPTDFDP